MHRYTIINHIFELLYIYILVTWIELSNALIRSLKNVMGVLFNFLKKLRDRASLEFLLL